MGTMCDPEIPKRRVRISREVNHETLEVFVVLRDASTGYRVLGPLVTFYGPMRWSEAKAEADYRGFVVVD